MASSMCNEKDAVGVDYLMIYHPGKRSTTISASGVSSVWQQVHDQLRGQVRQALDKAEQPSAGIIDSQSVKTTEKRGRSMAMTGQNGSKGANGLS